MEATRHGLYCVSLSVRAQNPHHLSPAELQRAVLERWLTTDIAESGLPVLPGDQFTTLTNVALQVATVTRTHRHTQSHRSKARCAWSCVSFCR